MDGEAITLTCDSATAAVDNYVWSHDGTVVPSQTSATWVIAQAVSGTHDGDYACVAKIDTVSSDASENFPVESTSCFVLCSTCPFNALLRELACLKGNYKIRNFK